jgi:hypothetical protein
MSLSSNIEPQQHCFSMPIFVVQNTLVMYTCACTPVGPPYSIIYYIIPVLCYYILYYTMLCYAMLCYAVLSHHIIYYNIAYDPSDRPQTAITSVTQVFRKCSKHESQVLQQCSNSAPTVFTSDPKVFQK